MTAVVLALGSNLGDRLANLQRAVQLLPEHGVIVDRVSAVWETAPVPADQPPFLNAVVAARTEMTPPALLAALKAIEALLGRRQGRRWGPRPIDLDILFYGTGRVDSDELTIPHPLIADRGFVLAPLSEVVEGPLPVLGVSALELLSVVGETGLTRTGLALEP